MPKQFMRGVMRRGHRAVSTPRVRRVFGSLLNNPNLWHLNRRSVAWAFALGLFMAFMPLPSQMVASAAVAIAIGCNLPIAAATVWISNPVTIPPIFYGCYRLGTWILSEPPRDIEFEVSLQWLLTKLADIWQPLLIGCLIAGTVSALLGYFSIHLLWRLRVVQSWRERRRRRANRVSA